MAKADMSKVASALPDDFVAGGLADDFDGKIVEARYVSWDYDGKIDNPVLAARLTIEVDESVNETGQIVQHWSAGALEAFKPSMDGEDEAEEGVYAMRVGSRQQLNNNTNWSQFLQSAIDSELPRDRFSPDIRFLEGVTAHFNRLPPTRKGGQMPNQDPNKKRDVLCITAIVDLGKGSKGGAPKSTGGAKAADKGDAKKGGGSLDSTVAALVATICKKEGGPVKKGKLAGLVLKQFEGSQADKQKATKMVGNNDWLESNLGDVDCVFDGDEGTITHTDNL